MLIELFKKKLSNLRQSTMFVVDKSKLQVLKYDFHFGSFTANYFR